MYGDDSGLVLFKDIPRLRRVHEIGRNWCNIGIKLMQRFGWGKGKSSRPQEGPFSYPGHHIVACYENMWLVVQSLVRGPIKALNSIRSDKENGQLSLSVISKFYSTGALISWKVQRRYQFIWFIVSYRRNVAQRGLRGVTVSISLTLSCVCLSLWVKG